VIERENLMTFSKFGDHRQPDPAPEGAVQEQNRGALPSMQVANLLIIEL
jgi:hypothetical protein